MANDWLWDKNLSPAKVKKVLADPQRERFLGFAALLLSRKNSAQEVFAEFLGKRAFVANWNRIKREMRKNSWNDPRIEYWQAVYEALSKKMPQVRPRLAKEALPFCKEIGEKIISARKNSGLTQRDLAKKLGVSQQIISRIESGRQNVSLKTLESIASALNLKLDISFEANIKKRLDALKKKEQE